MSYSVAQTGTAGRLRMTPGRITALAIGVPVVAVLIAAVTFSIVTALGTATYQVNRTIPVHADQVTARINGNLTLDQGGQNAAQLTGTATYSIFRSSIATDQTATGTVIGYRCGWGMGDCSLDGTLTVPADTPLSLDTEGGDVSAANYNGDLTLATDGGNVYFGTLASPNVLQLSTSGGDVTVNELRGPLTLTTDGGNINMSSVLDTAATSLIRTSGGDATMSFSKVPADLEIYSDGGNVRLNLPSGGYIFNVDGAGGNVQAPGSTPGATKTVTVRSSGGDVTIRAGS